MKRFAFALFILLALSASAQSGPDTTQVVVGKTVINVIEDTLTGKNKVIIANKGDADVEMEEGGEDEEERKNVDVGLFRMDLGMNMLLHEQGANLPTELNFLETRTPKSIHTGFHFLPTRINLIRHHVNLTTALDYDVTRFSFIQNNTLQPNLDSLTFLPDSVVFTRNRLVAGYFQIPLMLSFETSPLVPEKNFHFSFGAFAGILAHGKLKQKSEARGKVDVLDDYNMNKIRYGLTARIGYRGLDLYCNYTLSPLFREDQAPNAQVNSVSFGISLTGMLGN